MIDIHTHILPGIDDGARDMDEALAMARLAVEAGLKTVVATPHAARFGYFPEPQEVQDRVKELNQALAAAGIPLNVCPGAEYLLEPDLAARAEDNQLITINNNRKHVLVELPETMVPPYIEEVLYSLQLRGLTPVLAHPERNRFLMEKSGLLIELVRRGVLLQVTTGSLTGAFGGEIQKNSFGLLKAGLVHFVASDAHSTGRRRPGTVQAEAEMRRRVGQEKTIRILYENPEILLDGGEVETFLNEKPAGVFRRLMQYRSLFAAAKQM